MNLIPVSIWLDKDILDKLSGKNLNEVFHEAIIRYLEGQTVDDDSFEEDDATSGEIEQEGQTNVTILPSEKSNEFIRHLIEE